MKRISRILGILIAIAMIFSVIPMGSVAYAAEGDVEINADNFPDYFFRGYVSGFDKNKDDVLDSEEIAAVKEIRTENVSSLIGVEYFTELEVLTCGLSGVEELDVSQNTKLKFLDCSSNNLTVLDVTHNTDLEYLNCAYNNILELDLTKNTKLESLRCFDNELTALDISNCKLLIYVHCGWNNITELDVTNNTKLDGLDCADNKIRAIDVSKNTELTELELGGTDITEIDVSNNTKLEYLSFSESKLTKLDISNNTMLKELYIYSVPMEELDISWVPNIRKAYLEGELYDWGDGDWIYDCKDETGDEYYCLAYYSAIKVITDTSKDFTVENNKYTVTGKDTVIFNGVTKASKTVKIPDTVKYIGKTFKVTEVKENALKKNKKIKNLYVGKNVSKIGKKAFYGCKNLKKAVLYTTKLTKANIGSYAFKGINAKAKIKVPKSKLKAYKKILKTKGIKKQKITK